MHVYFHVQSMRDIHAYMYLALYLSCTLSFLLFYFPRRSVASFPFVLSVVLQKGSQRRNVKVHFTWEKLNSNGLHRFLEKKISILQVITENVQNS